MAQLWYVNIHSISLAKFHRELLRLPSYLQEEITAYRNINDQKLKLYARRIIQEYCIENHINFQWSSWNVRSSGKPEIPHINFNISHSGKYVIVAFSHNEIGIDIEEIKHININDISESLHPDELNALQNTSETLPTFYKIWTRKEAYLKAVGVGIIGGLNNENCLESIIRYKNQDFYFIQSIPFEENYVVAVCQSTNTSHSKFEVKKFYE